MGSIIFIDWDDTLFPTSWSTNLNINIKDGSKSQVDYFEDLDKAIAQLLTVCNKNGTVVIVTHALPIWIKICGTVLPRTRKILENIKVVSAREEYKDVTNPENWKKMAFAKEVNNQLKLNQRKQIKSVVSIGDAEYEYNALVELHKVHKGVDLKAIKLIKNPTIAEVYDEIKMLTISIPKICAHRGDLDLNFKQNNK
jgi:hypothetical protein